MDAGWAKDLPLGFVATLVSLAVAGLLWFLKRYVSDLDDKLKELRAENVVLKGACEALKDEHRNDINRLERAISDLRMEFVRGSGDSNGRIHEKLNELDTALKVHLAKEHG